MNLTIAASQFPVDTDIRRNTTYVVHHMQLAKKNGAKVIHFPEVDTDKKFYDSTIAWRDRAINGIFHSGSIVRDKRSDNRTQV